MRRVTSVAAIAVAVAVDDAAAAAAARTTTTREHRNQDPSSTPKPTPGSIFRKRCWSWLRCTPAIAAVNSATANTTATRMYDFLLLHTWY